MTFGSNINDLGGNRGCEPSIVIDTQYTAGAMAASVQELTQQIINLGEKLTLATQRISDLENSTPIQREETKMRGGLGDRELLRPDKLIRQADFKEWAEEYVEYVESQGKGGQRMAELLGLARESQVLITGKGETAHEISIATDLYKNMKKFVVLPEAKTIVVNAPDKNPFEAWRQLYAKYDPRNDSTAQQMQDLILDKGRWKCARIEEVPTKLSQWEAMQREHHKRIGEEAINASSKRALLKSMLPDTV